MNKLDKENKQMIALMIVMLIIGFLLIIVLVFSVYKNIVKQSAIVSLEVKIIHKYHFPLMANYIKTNVGAEYEMSGLTVWDQFNNENTNNKISIFVPDIIDSAYDYDIDWNVPDRKVNNHHIYWIDVKMWVGDPTCKLPDREYWSYYAWIVQETIDRYHPDVIAIYNEPDIDQIYEDTAQYFGCLGLEDAKEYGEFVKFIHQNTSNADIAIGEVCDIYSDFIKEALSTSDNEYDRLSFHCYEHFSILGISNTCMDKYNYAKTLTDKPVHISETGVIYQNGNEDQYENAQVNHFNILKNNIPTEWFWYTGGYHGWPWTMPSTDMLKVENSEIVPRKVWYEYWEVGR